MSDLEHAVPDRMFSTSPDEAERLGIISCIHGNLEALEAVLADLRAREIDSVLCLGVCRLPVIAVSRHWLQRATAIIPSHDKLKTVFTVIGQGEAGDDDVLGGQTSKRQPLPSGCRDQTAWLLIWNG